MRTNMQVLRGYNAVRINGDGTADTTTGTGYSVGQGITDASGLLNNIFSAVLTNKNQKAARDAELASKRLDNEIALAQSQMAQSNNAAQQAQLEALITHLKIEQANAQQQAMQQTALAQTAPKTLSPLGWGLIAVGVGGTVYLITRKR